MARSRFRLALGVLALGAALLATACGGSSSGGTPQQGGVATWAENPTATPDWIFPFIDPSHNEVNNTFQFQYLMYRPLYWIGVGNQPSKLNTDLSLAQAPVYTGDKAVINLKDYSWSNGEKVSPTDVEFFLNMLLAEKSKFAWYVKGEFPDNVKSVQTTGPSQVTLTLDGTYSPDWFTGNQLFELTPMPAAWDKTSDSAAAGSGGCATDESRCAAVYNYLLAKNKNVTGYATDPLWSVVDGPWKLKSFTSEGAADFVPNPKYSGPDKPKLDGFNEVPYTTQEAMYNAELAGNQVNVGPVPTNNLPKRDPNSSNLVPATSPLGKNYTLTPMYVWGWAYALLNYANPTIGPAVQQQYVREALQETVDQITDAAVAWRGYAVPTTGPVPTNPSTDYVSQNQHANNGLGLYPFNIGNAKKLLTSHGWTLQNGVMTCTDAGTGDNQCGSGVAAGTKLAITIEYNNSNTSLSEQVQQWKSDASQAGIQLTLDGQQFNTLISDVTTCPSNSSTCGWQLADWGYYTYGAVPAGNLFFLPDSAANYGSYRDQLMPQLINATLHDAAQSTFSAYETYAAQQLPGAINVPNPYKVYAVSANLQGVAPLNPSARITPETWYFTK
ncbi:MAG TPA: ABC transporter substrate-binding protein [Pseudonocardiaceae bacterium]|jgi:peptide/nickel transport system substrate-binding protein|nr:ABC transporter substrate-binding protein [Pseudonocardiaceae bacterium]